MEGHVLILKDMTDLIAKDGFDVKLVGFLGGEKLPIESPPHLAPGDFAPWGPVDEFVITNARRPVDFYVPAQNAGQRDLHGYTKLGRGAGCELAAAQEKSLGVLWLCRALSVTGEPMIQFRASMSSTSITTSSTRIRKIMAEARDEDLYEGLKDQVLGVGLLVDYPMSIRVKNDPEVDEIKAIL